MKKASRRPLRAVAGPNRLGGRPQGKPTSEGDRTTAWSGARFRRDTLWVTGYGHVLGRLSRLLPPVEADEPTAPAAANPPPGSEAGRGEGDTQDGLARGGVDREGIPDGGTG
jgi:hypothetical protein